MSKDKHLLGTLTKNGELYLQDFNENPMPKEVIINNEKIIKFSFLNMSTRMSDAIIILGDSGKWYLLNRASKWGDPTAILPAVISDIVFQ